MASDYAPADTKEPGLHKVGPEPYAYVFNPTKGQRLTFVGLDVATFTGTVTDFSEDKETGELSMTLQEFPDAPQYSAS